MAKNKRVQARVTPITRAYLDEIQAQTGENDAQWIARHAASEHRAMFPILCPDCGTDITDNGWCANCEDDDSVPY